MQEATIHNARTGIAATAAGVASRLWVTNHLRSPLLPRVIFAAQDSQLVAVSEHDFLQPQNVRAIF